MLLFPTIRPSNDEKKSILISAVIVIGLAVVLVLTFKRPEEIILKPDAPAVLTEPGEYRLDQYRVIEIREEDGEVGYYEVVYEEDSGADRSPALVSYAVNHIEEIKLSKGWSISLEKPSTVVVQTETGETSRREFGQRPPPVKDSLRRSVIKRNPVISGEPKAIPMDDIDSGE